MGDLFKGDSGPQKDMVDQFSRLVLGALNGNTNLPGIVSKNFTLPQYNGPLGVGINQSQQDMLGLQNLILQKYFGGGYNVNPPSGIYNMPTMPQGGYFNPAAGFTQSFFGPGYGSGRTIVDPNNPSQPYPGGQLGIPGGTPRRPIPPQWGGGDNLPAVPAMSTQSAANPFIPHEGNQFTVNMQTPGGTGPGEEYTTTVTDPSLLGLMNLPDVTALRGMTDDQRNSILQTIQDRLNGLGGFSFTHDGGGGASQSFSGSSAAQMLLGQIDPVAANDFAFLSSLSTAAPWMRDVILNPQSYGVSTDHNAGDQSFASASSAGPQRAGPVPPGADNPYGFNMNGISGGPSSYTFNPQFAGMNPFVASPGLNIPGLSNGLPTGNSPLPGTEQVMSSLLANFGNNGNISSRLNGGPALNSLLGGAATDTMSNLFTALDNQRKQSLNQDIGNLREQYSNNGLRFGTDLSRAITDRQSQSENNLLAQVAGVMPQITAQDIQGKTAGLGFQTQGADILSNLLLNSPGALTSLNMMPYAISGAQQGIAQGDLGLLTNPFNLNQISTTQNDTNAARAYQEFGRTQNLFPSILGFLGGTNPGQNTPSPFTQGVNAVNGIGQTAATALALKSMK